MLSQYQNEAAVPASAGQLAEAAASLRRDLAGPDAVESLPVTLARIADAVDDLVAGVLVLGDTVARSSSRPGAGPDLDHLPPQARALCWHLHDFAARLRAARASAETAISWAPGVAADGTLRV